MIVREFYKTREDGVNLYKSYSDKNYYIKKIGTDEVYDEAVDVEGAPYLYEETNKKIEELNEIELKAQAYDILVGEAE